MTKWGRLFLESTHLLHTLGFVWVQHVPGMFFRLALLPMTLLGTQGVLGTLGALGILETQPGSTPTPTPTATPTPGAGAGSGPAQIQAFFGSLTQDLLFFALAFATFFFAWAAIQFAASGATGNERGRQHAQTALYLALVGLALALLAGVIAGIVKSAVPGQ